MDPKDRMRILVLDDDDERHEKFKHHLQGHNVEHVFTVDGIITVLLAEPNFDVVFLDHDLNDNWKYKSVSHIDGDNIPGYIGKCRVELNGVDVASFIAKILPKEKRPKAVVVHSWNPEGAEKMLEVLRETEIKLKKWEWHPKQHPLQVTGLGM